MKKILIYYGYSQKNAGDMAICFGVLDLLKNLSDCQITMVSRYSSKDPLFQQSKEIINKYHPNVTITPGYVPFDRNSGILSKLKSYFIGFFLSTFPCMSKKMRRDIADKDLILFNGGNYLRCNSFTDKLRIKALFFPIKYAKKKRKTIVCLPQSTAKAKNKKSLKVLKKVISYFDCIFIRDPISFKYLVDNKIASSDKLVQSCDLAFFTNEYVSLKNNDDASFKKKIAINIRTTGIGDIGSIDKEKINLIYETYTSLITNNPDYFFDFVCQTEKDDQVMYTFYLKLKNKGITNIGYLKSDDAYYLKGVYKNHNLLISMRLHASILSISVGTPVIGFAFDEWGFKNSGILNQFGYSNFKTKDEILEEFEKIFKKDSFNRSKTIDYYKKELINVLNKF